MGTDPSRESPPPGAQAALAAALLSAGGHATEATEGELAAAVGSLDDALGTRDPATEITHLVEVATRAGVDLDRLEEAVAAYVRDSVAALPSDARFGDLRARIEALHELGPAVQRHGRQGEVVFDRKRIHDVRNHLYAGKLALAVVEQRVRGTDMTKHVERVSRSLALIHEMFFDEGDNE
jgi:hypothetical protein